MSFKEFPDLALDSNGGRILFATDDFFAVAGTLCRLIIENMISYKAPVFDPFTYTEFGTVCKT